MDHRIVDKIVSQHKMGRKILIRNDNSGVSTIKIPNGGPLGFGSKRYKTDRETVQEIKTLLNLERGEQ